MPTPAEIAWAAGLFEGEGCWKMPYRGNVGAAVASTDRDVLEKFAAIVKCGAIHSRKRQQPHHKDQWIWTVTRRHEVKRLFALFEPWLCDRRLTRGRQLMVEIAKIDERRLMAPCAVCGNPVVSGDLGSPRTYCSRSCRARANRLRNHEQILEHDRARYRKRTEALKRGRKCDQCGAEIPLSRRRDAKQCSLECSRQAKAIRATRWNSRHHDRRLQIQAAYRARRQS